MEGMLPHGETRTNNYDSFADDSRHADNDERHVGREAVRNTNITETVCELHLEGANGLWETTTTTQLLVVRSSTHTNPRGFCFVPAVRWAPVNKCKSGMFFWVCFSQPVCSFYHNCLHVTKSCSTNLVSNALQNFGNNYPLTFSIYCTFFGVLKISWKIIHLTFVTIKQRAVIQNKANKYWTHWNRNTA